LRNNFFMRPGIYIILIILLLASSCGEYEKLLKSTDYDLKKTKAKEYFEAGQYIKATELLDQVIPRYRATEEAEDLNWMNAQGYFGMKQYDVAGSYFKSYTDQYPYGKYAEEATYMTAFCDYNLSPRPELDQDYTKNAIEEFKVFLGRYPNSPKVDDCNKYINDLKEKLVEKSYLSAKLYYDMGDYKAAVVALKNSLKEYADTKYREEMMYLKLNSLFLYAEKSFAYRQKERYQDTLDDYYSFMEEFPESKFAKDVKKIFQETAQYLKINVTSNNNTQVNTQ
jgi:outer membrane protein assembly factor BamD